MTADNTPLPSRLVAAIDGPAGSGKSTLAKLLAEKIGGVYIDTGAMYRSVTAKALDSGVDPKDEYAVGRIAESIKITFHRDGAVQKTFVDGADFSERIRRPDVNASVSIVAAQKPVRDKMVALQREMGRHGRIVMEGRDIGTNVFPDADFKFFLVADDRVRAYRRLKEMETQGHRLNHGEVLANLRERDAIDSGRAEAPLAKAADAMEIDTSHLSIDEVLQKMLQIILFRLGGHA
ncbi:MAG: (d)CMP kinase [Nitrospinae bacterium]|nr:(d)CMP kinase [Nitrospinota bacterium]